jgi:REP element-mobilizing transposase RayT
LSIRLGLVELPKRKVLPHETPVWVKPGELFFITICCQQRGENQLCRTELARALIESVCFRQERGDWFVRLFLLMPDHLHALISFPRESSMKAVVAKWKEYSKRHLGIVWQRGFFDHRLRKAESLDEKAHYIRMNPVRQGLVGKPEDWPWVWEGWSGVGGSGPTESKRSQPPEVSLRRF